MFLGTDLNFFQTSALIKRGGVWFLSSCEKGEVNSVLSLLCLAIKKEFSECFPLHWNFTAKQPMQVVLAESCSGVQACLISL